MLKPLYDYAMRYQLLPPPGMVKKTVKAWVCLGANGMFLGVRQDGEDEYFACICWRTKLAVNRCGRN